MRMLCSCYDCKSTLVFAIAQNDDVELNLMGFNKNSYEDLRNIVFDLFGEIGNLGDFQKDYINLIDEKLKVKLDEVKLRNLEIFISNIGNSFLMYILLVENGLKSS